MSLPLINTDISRKILSSTERLDAINETVKALYHTVFQSNAALSAQVQAVSQKLTTLEQQGTHVAYFYYVNVSPSLSLLGDKKI